MTDVSSIGQVHLKKMTPMRSELKVSLERSAPVHETATPHLTEAKIEMENAERAFALMMKIREEIETAYKSLSAEER